MLMSIRSLLFEWGPHPARKACIPFALGLVASAALHCQTAAGVTWVALPSVAPGSTSQTSYYAVTVQPVGSAVSVSVAPFVPAPQDFTVTRVVGQPVAGSLLWCLAGSSKARVLFLARVAVGQIFETVDGVPRWTSTPSCGLAVPMPADTIGVHAVVVELVAGLPP